MIKKLFLILSFLVYLALTVGIFLNSYHPNPNQVFEFLPFWLYLLFGLSYVLFFLLWRKKKVNKWFWLGAILIIGIAFLSYPSTSADWFRYLYDGDLVAHGISPYEVLPVNLEVNQYSIHFAGVWWESVFSPYGPLWQFLMLVINFISGGSLLGGLVLLKLLNLFFLIVGYRLILKMVKSSTWAYLFLINPVVILNTVHTPHPDILIAVALLYILSNYKIVKSALFLSLTLLIKLNTIIFIPLWLWGKRFWSKLLAGISSLVIVLLGLWLILRFGFFKMLKAGLGGAAFMKSENSLFGGLFYYWPDHYITNASLIAFVVVYLIIFILFWQKRINRVQAMAWAGFWLPVIVFGTGYSWHFLIPLALFFVLKSEVMILFISVFTFLSPINMPVFLLLFLLLVSFYYLWLKPAGLTFN